MSRPAPRQGYDLRSYRTRLIEGLLTALVSAEGDLDVALLASLGQAAASVGDAASRLRVVDALIERLIVDDYCRREPGIGWYHVDTGTHVDTGIGVEL